MHTQLTEDYKYLPSVRPESEESCHAKKSSVFGVCEPVCSDSCALVTVR